MDTPLLLPQYAQHFRCIGPACEDSCCTGWTVPIDEAAFLKYQSIPAGPLRSRLDENLVQIQAAPEGAPPPPPAPPFTPPFATVKLTADRACPFLNPDKLCQIQAEHGEDFLSITCKTYPRIAHTIDGLRETALTLSCPEAARLVLLNPALLPSSHSPGIFRWSDPPCPTPQNAGPSSAPATLVPYFWPIREFVVQLLTNRAYPIWQRLFLLGLFTRRLAALASGELDRPFSTVREQFKAAIDQDTLRNSMETIPADPRLQLDMVLRLASLRLPRSHVGPRFIETVHAFTQGIGNAPGATMESLVAHYTDAYANWYEPFFAARPHILENLLLNAVVRTLYPFGIRIGEPGYLPAFEREFALLATAFTLLKGLLIGVAGFHRQSLAVEHVLQTVQSATKHFEHHPQFLEEAHALLVASSLDNTRGLTMLVRN